MWVGTPENRRTATRPRDRRGDAPLLFFIHQWEATRGPWPIAIALAGLDEDILEYIVGMLEGDEEPEEMEAAVADFLLSCEHRSTGGGAGQVYELFAEIGVKKAVDISRRFAQDARLQNIDG